jgi:hypothetical protein
MKISLTCIPALGPLFTYFREITSSHPSSSRRNPFDSSEIQSAEGITGHAPTTQGTNPYISAAESDPYSKFSRSQDYGSETGITSHNRAPIHYHHSLDPEIKEAFPEEVGNRSIQSSDKRLDGVDESITR